jgi:hypothetical protein
MIRGQVLAASVLSFLSYLCFRRVRVRDDEEELRAGPRPSVLGGVRLAVGVLTRDQRFRRYLIGCCLFGFSGLLYVSFIPALLVHDLGFGYVRCALLTHVIPSLASFVCTGYLGGWFDRTNPLTAWFVVRLGWGLDALVLAAVPAIALFAPASSFPLCAAARILRGSVMGGSYILWWQIGTNYFTPPGADTARYMGILTGLNGVMRLLAPLAGVLVLSYLPRPTVLLVGGTGVILSAARAWRQGQEDRKRTGFRVFADLERESAGSERDSLRRALTSQPKEVLA